MLWLAWGAVARWFTGDAAKAAIYALAGICIVGAVAWLYHDVKASGAAVATLRCQETIASGNAQEADRAAAAAAASMAAAQVERERRRADSAQAVARALEIERQIKALPDDPVCIPKALAKALVQ